MGKLSGFVEVAALVTVAGICVYVVGLLGLAVAMRLRLIDNLSTAWFVVSLLPRTIVAGQGVRIWLTWPLPFATLLVGLNTSVVGLTNSPDSALVILERSTASLGLGVLSLYLVLVLYSIQKTEREKHNRNLVGHFVVATIVAAFGGFLMSQGALAVVGGLREAAVRGLEIPIEGVLPGTMLFLVGGFLVGVPAAATIDHPLPLVRVKTDPMVETKGLLALLKHRLYLVGHVDGTWHFIDDDRNVLLSIPEKIVLAIGTCQVRGADYIVYDQAHEKIGKFTTKLLLDKNCQPEFIVVKMGLLRLRFTLMPCQGSTVDEERQKIVVSTDKETAKQAPSLDDDKVILSPKFKNKIRSFYVPGNIHRSA